MLLDEELEMIHHQDTLKTESANLGDRRREGVGGRRTMSNLTEMLVTSMPGVFSALVSITESQKIDLEVDFSLSFGVLMRV